MNQFFRFPFSFCWSRNFLKWFDQPFALNMVIDWKESWNKAKFEWLMLQIWKYGLKLAKKGFHILFLRITYSRTQKICQILCMLNLNLILDFLCQNLFFKKRKLLICIVQSLNVVLPSLSYHTLISKSVQIHLFESRLA